MPRIRLPKAGPSRAAEPVAAYGSAGGAARLNVVVGSELRAALEQLAAREARTVSEVCRDLLASAISERRRRRIYDDVARGYASRRTLYLDLIRAYEGIDEEVRRP
jgi:DNA-binding transcriptional MocR family regulator